MSAGTRLGAFGAGLAVLAGVAFAVGKLIDPDVGETAAAARGHGHGADEEHRELRLVPASIQQAAGRPARLTFQVVDADGEPVRDYDREHEADMHLIVVRRDLTRYQHLHPTTDGNGRWSVDLTLDDPGVYRAFADFTTKGERQTLGLEITVPGDLRPEPLVLRQDVDVDGYRVRLETVPDGDGELLRFHVTRDGRPVEDLEPYLGALGHLVVLREGDLTFLHVHPEDGSEPGTIEFAAAYPSAGRYGLFLQFQTAGVVHTAPLAVEVEP